MLGPILFLAYINDLPEQVKSKVRLFADDTVVYITMDKQDSPAVLQGDLKELELWETLWTWNSTQVSVRLSMKQHPDIPFGQTMFYTVRYWKPPPSARYLGVDISDNMNWSDHTNR